MSVKSRRRGVAWNGAWTGVGDISVELAGLGGGLHDGLAATRWDDVGGDMSVVTAIPPLEIHTWAPLDDQASGTAVAGGMEERADATIQRCLVGW